MSVEDKISECMEKLVSSSTYVQQAAQAKHSLDNQVRHLLEQRKWPDAGWTDQQIEYLINKLSMMDSNNFPGNCGVGEREGRVASVLVSRRHYHLAHGIGRSGDIAAVQPKAAGSSVMNKLTNALLLDALQCLGVPSTTSCFLVPMATGMALVLCLLALRSRRPNAATAKFVIWPRIDQKSCFKAIITAGFEPIIIENLLVGDELRTDLSAIESAVESRGADSMLCVLSTTSCFAPRAVDDVVGISALCARHGIPHLVNNAYGMQDTKCMHVIEQGHRLHRGVDLYVQSTDKNLLVPVGGAIIAGFESALVSGVSESYPGRASATPTLDVLITLLSLGKLQYRRLVKERKEMFATLKEELRRNCCIGAIRLLDTPHNPISVGLALRGVGSDADITQLGSMLFMRNVSGTRVVTSRESKVISGHTFSGYQSHINHYPHAPYLTAAAAIGITKEDIKGFIKRLTKVIHKFMPTEQQKSDATITEQDNAD